MKARAITVTALLGLAVQTVNAADVVGYNRIDIPANADVRMSIPFNQEIQAAYTVDTDPTGGSTLKPTVALTAGQFSGGSFYVRFSGGSGEGLWSTVTSNDGVQFTLEDTQVLNFVDSGDTFRVYKHHTLGSMFPARLLGKFFNTSTQILIYDNNRAAMAQNRPAAKVAFWNAATKAWVGAGGVNNNTILKPETQFILRNNSSDATLMVLTYGDAPDYTVSQLIAANGDLNIGSGYPVDVVLKNSGLEGNLRQVLFYNNTTSGLNKSASKTAFFVPTPPPPHWAGAGVTGNELIESSASITFRLPSAETGTRVIIPKPY